MNNPNIHNQEKITTIIPAIMPKTWGAITRGVDAVYESVAMVQIDIIDGVLMKRSTWPYRKNDMEQYDLSEIPDEFWKDLLDKEKGLPHWDEIDYELDLMISNVEDTIDTWIAVGPRRIIVHAKTLQDPHAFFEKVQGIRDYIQIGIAVQNDAGLEQDLFPHLEMVDCVQIMGIEKIGVQGAQFDPRTIVTIEKVRTFAPHIPIQIDGSVNVDTIGQLHEAGATRFIAGSAVYGEGEPVENVHSLDALL